MLKIFLIVFLLLIPFGLLEAASEPVTFIIQITSDIFDPETRIQIRVFNQDQLKEFQDSSGCTLSFDPMTGAEQLHCQSESLPELPSPEEFIFPVQDLLLPLVLPSRSILSGQQYRLVISGRHRDGCNTTLATAQGVADTSRIELSDFEWSSTGLDCPEINSEPDREPFPIGGSK